MQSGVGEIPVDQQKLTKYAWCLTVMKGMPSEWINIYRGPVPERRINYTRYNSYSRDKSAILGITIPGIKMGSWKHYLSLEWLFQG